jgi:hypothetical protein
VKNNIIVIKIMKRQGVEVRFELEMAEDQEHLESKLKFQPKFVYELALSELNLLLKSVNPTGG